MVLEMIPHQEQPVIFLAFANKQGDGSDGYLRELPEEFRKITEALDPLEAQGATVKPAPFATLKNILDKFRDFRDCIAVFHFAGHANSYNPPRHA